MIANLGAIVLLGLASLASISHSDDILGKVDGGVTIGTIVEKVPGNYVRLKTSAGDELLFPWQQLKTINGEAIALFDSRHFSDQNWICVFQIGFGLSIFSDLEWALASNVFSSPFESRQVNLELLGVFWPLKNRKTYIGPVFSQTFGLNMTAARLAALKGKSAIAYTEERAMGISVIRSLTGRLGDAWFARGDLVLTSNSEESIVKWNANSLSTQGFGFNLALGYTLPNDAEKTLVPQLSYSPRWIGGSFTSRLGINLGLWW